MHFENAFEGLFQILHELSTLVLVVKIIFPPGWGAIVQTVEENEDVFALWNPCTKFNMTPKGANTLFFPGTDRSQKKKVTT